MITQPEHRKEPVIFCNKIGGDEHLLNTVPAFLQVSIKHLLIDLRGVNVFVIDHQSGKLKHVKQAMNKDENSLRSFFGFTQRAQRKDTENTEMQD
jgi:hypothetical protein